MSVQDILLRVLREMDPEEAQRFLEDAESQLEASQMPEPIRFQGSAKDDAVQAYAGYFIRLCREPLFRESWVQIVGDRRIPYRELGNIADITRERARQLHLQLEPDSYNAAKRQRSVA